MSETKYTYTCSRCNKTAEASADENAPFCCGMAMVKTPLPQCTIAEHAEMVRNADKSDACDDGRGKNQ